MNTIASFKMVWILQKLNHSNGFLFCIFEKINIVKTETLVSSLFFFNIEHGNSKTCLLLVQRIPISTQRNNILREQTRYKIRTTSIHSSGLQTEDIS